MVLSTIAFEGTFTTTKLYFMCLIPTSKDNNSNSHAVTQIHAKEHSLSMLTVWLAIP